MIIPTLDAIVLEALDFFAVTPPPSLDISKYSLPFVVGSGNAINTGKILFSGTAAIFADESNFRSIASAYAAVIGKGLIRDAVIISASGEKDSVWELELAKRLKLKTTLLTCKPNSTGAKLADEVYAYKSIAEPYTYNTSTYLGMILSVTHEDPSVIKSFINKTTVTSGFRDYEAYAFILPDVFQNVAPIIEIKRDELFGPHVMIRSMTQGHARHAKFVHPWEHELVLGIGTKNIYFGEPSHQWDIALPNGAGFGTIMAFTYYLCGLIQRAKPDYFMQHIEAFCTDYGPRAYDKPGTFDVIVPANS